MASPSSFISCLSCGSTRPPCLRQSYHDLELSAISADVEIFAYHRRRPILRRIVFRSHRFHVYGQRVLPVFMQPRKGDLRRTEVKAEEIYCLPANEPIKTMNPMTNKNNFLYTKGN